MQVSCLQVENFDLTPDKLVVQDFDRSHKRDETGGFVVKLPFKPQGPHGRITTHGVVTLPIP